MENIFEERFSKKVKKLLSDGPTNSSDIKTEKEIINSTIRKNKIRNQIFNKKKNTFNENIINNSNSHSDINIQSLNITPQLKDPKFIKDLINCKNFDKIFEYIKEIYNEKNFNIDLVKYGLFCLNEKLLNNENKGENIIVDNFESNYNFKEIIYLLLMYSKGERKKIDYVPIILKLTYQILANYCYYCIDGINDLFLINEKLIELHLYFLEVISDKNIIKNILLMIYNISYDNTKAVSKILNFDNNKFFNLLIEYINDYPNDFQRIEIILDIFICYINIFNNFENKNKNQKDGIIEMRDNTIEYNWDLIENIYNISIILIYSKQKSIFSNSLFLISTIFKIIFKSNNFELMNKIINNNDTKTMILYILEKVYQDLPNDIGIMADLVKYIIKFLSNSSTPKDLKLNILSLINNIEQNLNENDEIIDIFIYLITDTKLKLKDKIITKLLEVLLNFIKCENFNKTIKEDYREELYEIIIKYINSSNYEIRRKIFKIIENMINKKDFALADYLIKNKIFFYIQKSIDPNLTFCHDEKIILSTLKIIGILLSIGELFIKLHGVNSALINFENNGGKELLHNLLCNKSELVYNASSQIIDRYFN